MTTRDISDPIAFFINEFAGIFQDFFLLLNSIEFMGTDLLSFSIAIIILGALFPLIFSIVSSSSKVSSSNRERKPRSKSNPKNNDSGDP